MTKIPLSATRSRVLVVALRNPKVPGASGMKTLTFPFERAGFRYELIEREGLICLGQANQARQELLGLRSSEAADRTGQDSIQQFCSGA